MPHQEYSDDDFNADMVELETAVELIFTALHMMESPDRIAAARILIANCGEVAA